MFCFYSWVARAGVHISGGLRPLQEHLTYVPASLGGMLSLPFTGSGGISCNLLRLFLKMLQPRSEAHHEDSPNANSLDAAAQRLDGDSSLVGRRQEQGLTTYALSAEGNAGYQNVQTRTMEVCPPAMVPEGEPNCFSNCFLNKTQDDVLRGTTGEGKRGMFGGESRADASPPTPIVDVELGSTSTSRLANGPLTATVICCLQRRNLTMHFSLATLFAKFVGPPFRALEILPHDVLYKILDYCDIKVQCTFVASSKILAPLYPDVREFRTCCIEKARLGILTRYNFPFMQYQMYLCTAGMLSTMPTFEMRQNRRETILEAAGILYQYTIRTLCNLDRNIDRFTRSAPEMEGLENALRYLSMVGPHNPDWRRLYVGAHRGQTMGCLSIGQHAAMCREAAADFSKDRISHEVLDLLEYPWRDYHSCDILEEVYQFMDTIGHYNFRRNLLTNLGFYHPFETDGWPDVYETLIEFAVPLISASVQFLQTDDGCMFVYDWLEISSSIQVRPGMNPWCDTIDHDQMKGFRYGEAKVPGPRKGGLDIFLDTQSLLNQDGRPAGSSSSSSTTRTADMLRGYTGPSTAVLAQVTEDDHSAVGPLLPRKHKGKPPKTKFTFTCSGYECQPHGASTDSKAFGQKIPRLMTEGKPVYCNECNARLSSDRKKESNSIQRGINKAQTALRKTVDRLMQPYPRDEEGTHLLDMQEDSVSDDTAPLEEVVVESTPTTPILATPVARKLAPGEGLALLSQCKVNFDDGSGYNTQATSTRDDKDVLDLLPEEYRTSESDWIEEGRGHLRIVSDHIKQGAYTFEHYKTVLDTCVSMAPITNQFATTADPDRIHELTVLLLNAASRTKISLELPFYGDFLIENTVQAHICFHMDGIVKRLERSNDYSRFCTRAATALKASTISERIASRAEAQRAIDEKNRYQRIIGAGKRNSLLDKPKAILWNIYEIALAKGVWRNPPNDCVNVVRLTIVEELYMVKMYLTALFVLCLLVIASSLLSMISEYVDPDTQPIRTQTPQPIPTLIDVPVCSWGHIQLCNTFMKVLMLILKTPTSGLGINPYFLLNVYVLCRFGLMICEFGHKFMSYSVSRQSDSIEIQQTGPNRLAWQLFKTVKGRVQFKMPRKCNDVARIWNDVHRQITHAVVALMVHLALMSLMFVYDVLPTLLVVVILHVVYNLAVYFTVPDPALALYAFANLRMAMTLSKITPPKRLGIKHPDSTRGCTDLPPVVWAHTTPGFYTLEDPQKPIRLYTAAWRQLVRIKRKFIGRKYEVKRSVRRTQQRADKRHPSIYPLQFPPLTDEQKEKLDPKHQILSDEGLDYPGPTASTGPVALGFVADVARCIGSSAANIYNALYLRHGATQTPVVHSFSKAIEMMSQHKQFVIQRFNVRTPTDPDYDWYKSWPEWKRKLFKEAMRDPIQHDRVSAFVKRETYFQSYGEDPFTFADFSALGAKKVRAIQGYRWLYTQRKTGPYIRLAQKAFCDVYNGDNPIYYTNDRGERCCIRLVIASSMNSTDISSLVDKAVAGEGYYSPNPYFFESDGKNWDASMQFEHCQAKLTLLSWVLGEEVRKILAQGFIGRGTAKFKRGRLLRIIRYLLEGTVKSGHNDTSLGNGLVNLVIALSLYLHFGLSGLIMVNGDDLLTLFNKLAGKNMEECGELFKQFLSGCGIVPVGRVFDDFTHVSFLSANFYALENGKCLFAPKVGRLLQRLGWTVKDVAKPAMWRRATALSMAATGLKIPIVRALLISMYPDLATIPEDQLDAEFQIALKALPVRDRFDFERRIHLRGNVSEDKLSLPLFCLRYRISTEDIARIEATILSYPEQGVICKDPLLERLIAEDNADPPERLTL